MANTRIRLLAAASHAPVPIFARSPGSPRRDAWYPQMPNSTGTPRMLKSASIDWYQGMGMARLPTRRSTCSWIQTGKMLASW